jgi:hypothetical protein
MKNRRRGMFRARASSRQNVSVVDGHGNPHVARTRQRKSTQRPRETQSVLFLGQNDPAIVDDAALRQFDSISPGLCVQESWTVSGSFEWPDQTPESARLAEFVAEESWMFRSCAIVEDLFYLTEVSPSVERIWRQIDVAFMNFCIATEVVLSSVTFFLSVFERRHEQAALRPVVSTRIVKHSVSRSFRFEFVAALENEHDFAAHADETFVAHDAIMIR